VLILPKKGVMKRTATSAKSFSTSLTEGIGGRAPAGALGRTTLGALLLET
jgi:hypothetical protein